MRQRFNTRQRNYIILGLCSILLIMAAGYAAFSSRLTINGTSNISSEWKVLITDIQSSVLAGAATDAEEPSHTETTATFKANLVSPGDSMQYDVTVENQGDIDAVLESIDVNTSDNEAILFETTGIKRGDKLLSDESDILTVIVTYNSEITDQPSNLNATVTVTLNYVQDDGSILPEPEGPSIGGISVPTVESGDGLYADEYEPGRYIYRGQDPDNYITFNNETWRIISKEADGTYKIIRNDVLSNRAFDAANHRSTDNNSYCTNPQSGCGVYAAVSGTFSSPSGSQGGTVTEDSSIKIYLNDDYYVNNINSTAKDQMTSHSFNIGAVENLNQSGAEADSIEKNIAGEKMYTWTGNVGLANVSDILRASTNPLCTSVSTSYSDVDACNSNYLLDRGSASLLVYWTINASSRESGGYSSNAWFGGADSSVASVSNYNAYSSISAPRPVVFLKSDTTLSGSGTESDPYTLS
mgnify:CR=1 FL=1